MTRASWTASAALCWSLRLALSVAFLYAGGAKLRDPAAFADSIASFRLLPPALISPVALTLPPLEIIGAALALMGGSLRRTGAFCLGILMLVFLAALASAQVRGLQVDCGCFGASGLNLLDPTKNLWLDLGRDLVLGVVAWILYWRAMRRP